MRARLLFSLCVIVLSTTIVTAQDLCEYVPGKSAVAFQVAPTGSGSELLVQGIVANCTPRYDLVTVYFVPPRNDREPMAIVTVPLASNEYRNVSFTYHPPVALAAGTYTFKARIASLANTFNTTFDLTVP